MSNKEAIMGVPSDAKDFLARYGREFENDAIQGWVWGGEDDDFGKALSWDTHPCEPESGQTVQANASVDLQLTQLTLAISERDLGDKVSPHADAAVVFTALLQFEDRTLTVDGDEREYSESEIGAVIREFNERTR